MLLVSGNPKDQYSLVVYGPGDKSVFDETGYFTGRGSAYVRLSGFYSEGRYRAVLSSSSGRGSFSFIVSPGGMGKTTTTQGATTTLGESSFCLDSDGGMVGDAAGSVSWGDGFNSGVFWDFCQENNVVEYYCLNGKPRSALVSCAPSCVLGACVVPVTATSSTIAIDSTTSTSLEGLPGTQTTSTLGALPVETSTTLLSEATSTTLAFEVTSTTLEEATSTTLAEEASPDVKASGIAEETRHGIRRESARELFGLDESPRFDFVVEENKSERGIVSGILSILSGSQESDVSAVVYDSSGAAVDVMPAVVKTGAGRFTVTLPSKKGFRAGVYRLEVSMTKDGVSYAGESEFSWGLVSLNTKKSIYRPGETADFIIVVLDRDGRSVCDAQVELEVSDPAGGRVVYSTTEGSVSLRSCGLYNASYPVFAEGNHSVSVHAIINGLAVDFRTFFLAAENYGFEVVRTADSKIDPTEKGSFNVGIDVSSFVGGGSLLMRERVPAEFMVETDAAVSVEGDSKVLAWDRELVGGRASVSYSYSVPHVWPFLYELGPVEIEYGGGLFVEARPWYVAVDPYVAGRSGMAAYQLASQPSYPVVRNWTASVWSAPSNVSGVPGVVRWVVLKNNPVRDEKILGTLDDLNNTVIQIFNVTAWASYSMTNSASISTRRAFHIGVEQVSGRVMVAYNNGSTGQVNYRIWNGTYWTPESYVVYNLTNPLRAEWVKLAESNGTDRLLLVVQTNTTRGFANLYAIPWNGTAWLPVMFVENQTRQSSTEDFDVAFEQLSGEAMVAWGDMGSANARYRTYSFATGWSAEGAAFSGGTAAISNVRLAPYPGSNRIMMCYIEAAAAYDLDCQEWDGGAWQTGFGVDTSMSQYAGTGRMMDVAPDAGTGGFLVMYGDQATNYFNFYQCNTTARCQAGTWTQRTLWSSIPISRNTSWGSLYPVPGKPGEFVALMLSQNATAGWFKGRLNCSSRNCSSIETPNSFGATSNVSYEGAMFAFDNYYPPVPTNLSVWDETDSMPYGGQVKYIGYPIVFYANYTNTSGYALNSSVSADAQCIVSVFNLTSWTSWYPMVFNASKGLYEYNLSCGLSRPGLYAWNVSCNASRYEARLLNDTLYVNNTVPNATLVGPLAADWVSRSNSSVPLRCNASDMEDSTGMLSVWFRWDASSSYSSPTSPVVNNTSSSNPFRVVFNAAADSECSAASIGATGRCYFQCYSNDSFNVSSAFMNSSFGIDGEAPTGYSAGISGHARDTWLAGSSFTVQCSGASDPNSGSGISSYDYEYTMAVGCSGGWAAMTGCTGVPGSCGWTNPPSDTNVLCVRCRANDAVGNSGLWDNASYSGVDNSPPGSCSVSAPTAGEIVVSSPYTLKANAADAGSGVANVSFYYYNASNWYLACNTTVAPFDCLWGVPLSIEDMSNIQVRANCTDNMGLVTESSAVSGVKIDVVHPNPLCRVIYPNGGEYVRDYIVVNASANGSGFAYPTANLTFEFSNDSGASWKFIGVNATNASYYYGFGWNTTAVGDGPNYTVRCTVRDQRGYEGQNTSGRNFTVDNTPPTINGVQMNETNPAVGTKICLNASVRDNFNVSAVWVFLDLPSMPDINTSMLDDGLGCDAAAGDGVYSYVYWAEWEGVFNWTKVLAADAAGNSNLTVVGISGNVTARAYLSILAIQPTSNVRVNESGTVKSYQQTCNVSCNASGENCDNAMLYVQRKYSVFSWINLNTTSTYLSTDINNYSCGNLLAGGSSCAYTFTVTAAPFAGNMTLPVRCASTALKASTVRTTPFNVSVNKNPAAAWTYPAASGSWIHGLENLNASGSWDAEGPLANYLFEIDNSTGFSSATVMCDGPSSNCTFDIATQSQCQLNNNSACFLRVTVTDLDGLSNSSVMTVGVDNGPIPSLQRPRDFENISSSEYTVNATFIDSGVGNVSFVLFEYRESPLSSWTSACNDTDTMMPYSCVWNTTSLPDLVSYEVRVAANDSLGNLGEYEAHTNITLDRQPPLVVLDLPAGQFNTSLADMTFNYTVMDNIALFLNCSLVLDSSAALSDPSAQNGTLSYLNLSNVPEGVHSWSVVCVDYAGGSNSSGSRALIVDRTNPGWSGQTQTYDGAYSGIIHRSEAINLSAAWSDNAALLWAWLETNETGIWGNKSAYYNSPQLLSGVSGTSSFMWANGSLSPGASVGWRIHANDTAGNRNSTGVMAFTVWGWAKVNASAIEPSEIRQGELSRISCQAMDNVSLAPIGNYVVYFYNSTSLLGTNATNASGWASFTYHDTGAGIEPVSCNISGNESQYYNHTSENEALMYLTTFETGAPILYRITSDPCESGTYCRDGVVVYNPNPTNTSIRNITFRWSTDYVNVIRGCCGPDGCGVATYCRESPAGTLGFLNRSIWTIGPYSYAVFWYEITNTNPNPGYPNVTVNVTTGEWGSVINTRVNVTILNNAACAWTSWSVDGASFDTNSSSPAILAVDAGANVQFTVRLIEFCNIGRIESTTNVLSVKIPRAWSYVPNSASWVGGGGSCLLASDNATLTCIPPNDILNNYLDLKLNLTTASSIERFNLTTLVNGSDGSNIVHEDANQHVILVRDYSAPRYSNQSVDTPSMPGMYHRGEILNITSYWTDNTNLKYAWLETNGSGYWENKSGVYGSPMYMGLANSSWTTFLWQNDALTPGSSVGVRIWANDTSGNFNSTTVMVFTVWGWAVVEAVDPANLTAVTRGAVVNVTCRVEDEFYMTGLGGYPVNFIVNGTYNTTVLTNDSGYVTFAFNSTPYGNGMVEIGCNITQNDALAYHAAGPFDSVFLNISQISPFISDCRVNESSALQRSRIWFNASVINASYGLGSFWVSLNGTNITGTAAVNGTSGFSWYVGTWGAGNYSVKCYVNDSAGNLNSTGDGWLEVTKSNATAELNLSLVNVLNNIFENTTIIVYDSVGEPAGNMTINSSSRYFNPLLTLNERYDFKFVTPLNASENLTSIIRGLVIAENISLMPQVVSSYSGAAPAGTSGMTSIFALNDTGLNYSLAEIRIPKRGLEMGYIAHCTSWDYTISNCYAWQLNRTSDYGMQQDASYLWFNVTHFDSFGGAQGNPLPNITLIRIYNVTGSASPKTDATDLVAQGLNATLNIFQKSSKVYRFEFVVKNDGLKNWTIDSSSIAYLALLNDSWVVNTAQIWYNVSGAEYSGGTWGSGNVTWNTSLGGYLDAGATGIFYYIVNITSTYSEQRQVYFLANYTTASTGSFDYSTLNITRVGYLQVNLTTPPNNTQMCGNGKTLVVNATVTCMDGECGSVRSTLKYNKTSSVPDTAVPTASDVPLYITAGSNPKSCSNNPLSPGQACSIEWTVNVTATSPTDILLAAYFNSTASDPATTESSLLLAKVIVMMRLNYSRVDFGVLNPLSKGANATQNNYGGYGVEIDQSSCNVERVYVKGTDLNATDIQEHSGVVYRIGVANITWNDQVNDYGSAFTTKMSQDYALVKSNMPAGTSLVTYYWLNVPGGLYAQNYTGYISFLANTSAM